MKKLGRIDGKTLKGFVEWLREQDCGCCHIPVGDTETQTVSICVGWSDYGDGDWRICAKIGMQSFNNCMQCDLDVDFEMPYDKESGEVYDTSVEVDCKTLKDYNALAAQLNRSARDAYKFQMEQEKKKAA